MNFMEFCVPVERQLSRTGWHTDRLFGDAAVAVNLVEPTVKHLQAHHTWNITEDTRKLDLVYKFFRGNFDILCKQTLLLPQLYFLEIVIIILISVFLSELPGLPKYGMEHIASA